MTDVIEEIEPGPRPLCPRCGSTAVEPFTCERVALAREVVAYPATMCSACGLTFLTPVQALGMHGLLEAVEPHSERPYPKVLAGEDLDAMVSRINSAFVRRDLSRDNPEVRMLYTIQALTDRLRDRDDTILALIAELNKRPWSVDNGGTVGMNTRSDGVTVAPNPGRPKPKRR